MHKLNIEKILKIQEEGEKKHGFYMHSISEENETHTHGLLKNFEHKELEILAPIGPETSWRIIHNVVDMIREGKVFEDGEYTDKIIKNFNILFRETSDGNLRMIFPDKHGKFEDTRSELFQRQFKRLKEPN